MKAALAGVLDLIYTITKNTIFHFPHYHHHHYFHYYYYFLLFFINIIQSRELLKNATTSTEKNTRFSTGKI
jgi:hypothetical protein